MGWTAGLHYDMHVQGESGLCKAFRPEKCAPFGHGVKLAGGEQGKAEGIRLQSLASGNQSGQVAEKLLAYALRVRRAGYRLYG